MAHETFFHKLYDIFLLTKKGHLNNICIQLNQVKQLAEHNINIQATVMVHCYQLNCKQSNIYTPIFKTHHLLHHRGRDKVVC